MVPGMVRSRLSLSEDELRYYCDPLTRDLFGFKNRVAGYIDTRISRMVVDLNRPPLPLPLRDPDGIIKVRTPDGKEIWRPGQVPDISLAHRLLLTHYFPYHQRIDELLDRKPVMVAFDCHSMLPHGSEYQKDAGKLRPLICLGNNGDRHGQAKKGSIATCSREWIMTLAGIFREEFPDEKEIAINNPFSGGFISNAHYWHKGIPWIQIEVNRSLYDAQVSSSFPEHKMAGRASMLKERIWRVLSEFRDQIGDTGTRDSDTFQ